MSLGNTNEQGNGSRSNFNWQFRVLKALGAIIPQQPGATEATLQQLLLAAQSESEFEALLVSDTGNSNLVVRQVVTYDTVAGVLNPPSYYRLDGTTYIPVGPLVYISSGAVTNDGTFATPALQTSGNNSLSSLNTNIGAQADTPATTDSGTFSVVALFKRLLSKFPVLVSGRFPVDGSAVTQPISALSLPLPSGGSTAALQTTGNNSLSSIDGKTPVLGQALAAASVPVVLTASQLSTLTPLSSLSINSAIPAGNNNIGDVDIASIAGGVISTINSSAITLGIGGTYTGATEAVTPYAWIHASVFSNVSSGTDGLSFQQSQDGINWDIVDTYTYSGGSGKVYSVQPAAQFFRVMYTNGGVAQTSFRLQVKYGYLPSKASSQRPSDGYTNETDLEQEQSFLMGFNGITWDRLRSSTTQGLQVDPNAGTWSYDRSTALEASSITSATPVRITEIRGHNNKTSAQYFHLFNSATVPADGTIPFDVPILVPAQTPFFISFGDGGLEMSTGAAWSNSSTLATKTIGSADMWVVVKYRAL